MGCTTHTVEMLLRSYSSDLTPVQGKADVKVQLRDNEAVLSFFVTGDGSSSLLGRNLGSELGVDFSAVEMNVHSFSNAMTVVHEFNRVLEEGFGAFKGAEAIIHVSQDTSLKVLNHVHLFST